MLNPKQESRFEYKGFPCVVFFIPLGHRCGYVGLPKGHEYYGKDTRKIPIRCHGGITFAENSLYGQDDNDKWWIGFDCAHYFDGVDEKSFLEYYGEESTDEEFNLVLRLNCTRAGQPVRTQEYVESECRKIVDQITGESTCGSYFWFHA